MVQVRLILRFAAAALGAALLCLSACGGPGAKPPAGPYRGTLSVSGAPIGDFAFTVADGLVAGTCTLTHNEQLTQVAISGSINGRGIVGRLHNENLGEGPFVGSIGGGGASGTFSYEDAGGVSTQTGTWSANVD